MANEATCVKCGRGPMIAGKVRRMPGAVVAIGFLLIAVSVIGLGLGGLTKAGGKALEKHGPEFQAEMRQNMEKEKVPEPLIAKAMSPDAEWLTEEELKSLTPQQQVAVSAAQLAKNPGLLGSAANLILAGSAIGLVLGWILRMKKPGLKCSNCGAAQAAA